MLKFLNIVNFAVIPRTRIEFNSGLNLLTGETGAGKSIIVDAISLLLGARASVEVVRSGERAATVEGIFELSGEAERRVHDALAAIGIELEGDEPLTVRRELPAAGRSRFFINDRSVTAATLRGLQPSLLELHGQGEQQALTTPRAQLQLLDAFGGCADLRAEVAEIYARRRQVLAALRAVVTDEAERARTFELLRYQLSELERVNPQTGEEEALAAERRLLAQVERAAELSASALSTLYESDESVLTRLGSVRRWLQELQAIDERVTPLLEALAGATITLTDAAEGLRQYGAGLEFSPSRLAEIENRLSDLERLRRKYGCGLDGLQEVRAGLRARLEELENWAERETGLQAELAAVEQRYEAAAARLSECRRKTAPLLAERVEAELRQVALERARFVVSLEAASKRREWVEEQGAEEEAGANYWSPVGAERVAFLLTANVGEEARALARVASGGELSRLMLALRTVLQGASAQAGASGATLIFDEIDTGIGGRVAEAVGRRLKALAATQQVLCVTHQPQIARFADHHYVVEKQVADGRTVALVREVEDEARVTELARMIGGAAESETTRETARWLLASAAESPSAGVAGAESARALRAPSARNAAGRGERRPKRRAS
ncbi:MAG TPA: DNA repair protein RecN [Pyrinomonadaceae bacterium]|jgi:DNA repair protein RecN (Recombination protein N)